MSDLPILLSLLADVEHRIEVNTMFFQFALDKKDFDKAEEVRLKLLRLEERRAMIVDNLS